MKLSKEMMRMLRDKAALLMSSNLEHSTLANGKVVLEMVKANRFGLMVPSTQENGGSTKPMATENLAMLMETYMLDSGIMTKQTALASTHI
jgi:hypothetical protein